MAGIIIDSEMKEGDEIIADLSEKGDKIEIKINHKIAE